MKCELTLEICDLHADPNDRPPKQLKVPKNIFSQVDVTTMEQEINQEQAEKSEKAKTQETKRIEIQPLVAFRDDRKYRLGGSHGKIMGLFKEVGSVLYTRKVPGFAKSYKPFLKSMIIKPMYIQLEDVGTVTVNKMPQIMAGRSKALIMLYYEKIDKCTATVNIEMPDGSKSMFEKLLEQAEGMPFGPRRRGEITVIHQEWHN